MTGGGWEKSGTDYESTAPGSFTSGLSDSNSDRDGGGGNVTIDYTHKFNDRHSLMASASYNLWSMPSSVLMSETESAPAASTAKAMSWMLVTLGESFTMRCLR